MILVNLSVFLYIVYISLQILPIMTKDSIGSFHHNNTVLSQLFQSYKFSCYVDWFILANGWLSS